MKFVPLVCAATAAAALSVLPAPPSGADPAMLSRSAAPAPGGWEITALGDGRWSVSWTATEPLPMTSDRPVVSGADLTFAPATVSVDGRTVTTTTTSRRAPQAADLDVVLSGRALDEAAPARTASPQRRAAGRAPATSLLDAPDPGTVGPFATVTSDYELPTVTVPDVEEPVEMVGHVVEPAADAATGPRPLVVFLHGRHDVCYDPADPDARTSAWPCAEDGFEEIPSHLGYDYLQRLLASQGYATVSIRANGINANDGLLFDGGIAARAALVREHLDHWATIAADHDVDLDEVVLVGHSRGGEGVDRASIQIPLAAPYRVVGQVLLAPTDFASHAASYVPTVTVLPYCDGDVVDLQGQRYTDTGRDVATDDTALRSSVLVMGANHNYFNSEWTPGSAAPSFDDSFGRGAEPCGRRAPGRLTAPGQRAVAKAYVAGAVHLFTGDDDYLPLVDGSHVTVPSIGAADVRSHAIRGGRDERRPGFEATPTLSSGATTRLCSGEASTDVGAVRICGGGLRTALSPHFASPDTLEPARTFFEMTWGRAGAVGGLRFDEPLDLRQDRLEVRTIVDSRLGAVDLRVRVTDSTGASAVLTPEGGAHVEPLPVMRELTKLWAQSLLVDASRAGGVDGADGVDLADVVSVELLADSARGRVWVADVSSAPSTLAPVPAVRLPQVSFGEVEVAEGDPSGTGPRAEAARIARIPFTVAGELTRPARVTVLTVGQEIGALEEFEIDLAPGQTSGWVPVRYRADRRADFDLVTNVSAWGVRGIVTDRFLGSVTIRDDDPAPRVSLEVPRTVREGRPVVVRVRTTGALADYDVLAFAEVVRGPGRPLQVADVAPEVLLGYEGSKPSTPLWQLGLTVSDSVAPGARRARIVLPTLRDAVHERPETLTLRITLGDDRVVTRTVRILDATR